MPSLNVKRFDGGMTDYWVDGPDNCGEKFENLLITLDKKLTSRPGSAIYSTTYAQTALGEQRIGKVFEFNGVIFLCQGTNLYYFVDGAGWTELTGGSATKNCFDGASGYEGNYSVAQWNNHLILTDDSLATPVRKAYKDSGATWRMFSAGLPAITWESSYPTATASAVGTTNSYIYAFHFFREYTLSGNVVFQDVGPVTLLTATHNGTIGVAGATMTLTPGAGGTPVWPSPPTSSNNFYDDAATYVKIYRTEANQDVPMLLTSKLVAATGTYVDSTLDAALGEEIYTAGDVLDYYPPPFAKYCVIANDIAWYGNVKEGSSVKPYRVRQAIQNAPDKCPESLYIDVDGDITGMGAVGNLPLVFCGSKFYRLEGYVDNLGTGFTKKVIVSDKIGCIASESIIQSREGVAFAAADGFYFTDGYNVTKLSHHLSKSTYKTYTKAGNDASITAAVRKKRITGAYDKATNRYWWAVMADDDSLDNDSCIIFDANQGIKEDGAFTTAVGGTSFAPTALHFVDGDMYRADKRGYLFLHEDDLYNDPVVDTGVAVTSWGSQVVAYDYISCAYSFGDIETTKYVTRFTLSCSPETNLSIQVQSSNDTTNSWSDLKEIRYRGATVWGDDDIIWGEDTILWNESGSMLAERRFPAGGLRCIYKQVRIKNSTTVIARSDDYETATMDNTANTAVLATEEWGSDIVGYTLVTAYDSYVEEFPITARTATTVTVTDTYGRFPTGVYAWEVWGLRRGERMLLDSYSIAFEFFGNTTQGYQSTGTGHNA